MDHDVGEKDVLVSGEYQKVEMLRIARETKKVLTALYNFANMYAHHSASMQASTSLYPRVENTLEELERLIQSEGARP